MTRRISKLLLLVSFCAGALWLPCTSPAHAGGAAKAVARGLVKRSVRPGRSVARNMARDIKRDGNTVARALTRPRTVHRYTSIRRARVERSRGIARGNHMTSRAFRGRPLSAANAQKRYGLPHKPQVRETIRLTRGQPVRLNKAMGGGRGQGELTSTRIVPATQVRRVVRLRQK